jgi:hypothetical protein
MAAGTVTNVHPSALRPTRTRLPDGPSNPGESEKHAD